MYKPRWSALPVAGVLLLLAVAGSCTEEYRPTFLGGTLGLSQTRSGAVNDRGDLEFTPVELEQRTYTDGRAVATVTYRVDDMSRQPYLIDFNQDGRVDPVIAYEMASYEPGRSGVIQILLSYGQPDTLHYASLTLDGGDNPWDYLRDVAVGDVDNDGQLDLVAATGGLVYLHHPGAGRTHVLREWGQDKGALEVLNGSMTNVTPDELSAIIAAEDPTANPDDYVISMEQKITTVELGDFNNDGSLDIATAGSLTLTLTPKPNVPAQTMEIEVGGMLNVFANPGGATTGEGWTGMLIGRHERHDSPDRYGEACLVPCDVDVDGDLDLVSAARADNNAQIAWFENPGGPGPLDSSVAWTQYRIGSVRRPEAICVADLTGDGRLDVVASSPDQMQLVLFVQPSRGPRREYDWGSTAIVNFESFAPRDVVPLDVDNDGDLELVVGGSNGAVRYCERNDPPTDPWTVKIVGTLDPPGTIGMLGYGDMDRDGDLDLLVVSDGEDAASERLVWLRNELLQP